MYYLHTTGKRSYTVGNITIPALAPAGKRQDWLQLDEAEFQELKSIKIMAGLISRGEIIVHNKVPAGTLLDAHESQNELATLKERVARLTDENVKLKADLEASDKAIKNGSNGNARALKELQAKYDALEKESVETIKKLQSQLADKG